MNQNEQQPDFNRLDGKTRTAFIPIKEINPGQRVRQEYTENPSKWDDFKDDLKKFGQIQAIAVMEYEKPLDNYKYFLLAGGRRLKALQELEQTHINATIYPHDLDAWEIKSIEFIENISRKDFTLPEKVKAQKDLFDYWVKKFGRKASGGSDEDGVSMRTAAKKMKLNVQTLSENLRIADMFKAMPTLEKEVKNRAEALALLKSAEHHHVTQKKIAEIKEVQSNKPIEKLKDAIIDNYIVHPQGFLGWSKNLQDKSINLVNFDPDYITENEDNITQKSSNRSKALGNYNSVTDFESFFKATLKESYRILQDPGWLIIWFGYEYFNWIQEVAKEIGFDTSYLHGKWKKNSNHTQTPHRYLGHTTEPFFYFRKGKAEIIKPHSDTYEYPVDSELRKINPYAKPTPLMQAIYTTFLNVGDRIVSPCVGSGSDILGAINAQCICIGVDKSEKQKELFSHKVLMGEVGKFE